MLQKFENAKWNHSEQYSLHMSFQEHKMQTGAKWVFKLKGPWPQLSKPKFRRL